MLDGGDETRILTIATSSSFGIPTPDSRIEVAGVTFQHGFDAEVAALKISDPGPIYGGHILVERNVFRANAASPGDLFGRGTALAAATDGPDLEGNTGLIVRNNVFDSNTGPDASAVFVFSNNPIELSNNTFAANRSTDTFGPVRVIFDHFSLSGVILANNVFWDNQEEASVGSFDMRLNAGVALYSNNLQASTGAAGIESNTTNVPPLFVDAVTGNYGLAANSPMIDSGEDTVSSGAGDFDAAGRSRVFGPHIDRGAFEFAGSAADHHVFGDGFE